MTTLPSLRTNQLIPLIEELSDTVGLRSNDSLSLKAQKGLVALNIKRGDTGETTTLQLSSNGAYKKMVKFDPSTLTPKQRAQIVKELRSTKMTQAAIAAELGVSQATVSNDLHR